MKSIRKYVKVMGVLLKGTGLVTDKSAVLRLLTDRKNSVQILSRGGGNVIFYFDPATGDVVCPEDIVYKYVVAGRPATAKDLVDKARSLGYSGISTSGAASVLRLNGYSVSANPNPTNKYVI